MTEHTDLPDVEDEVSRRTARLEKLAQHFGNPFHLTQFAKTHAANEIKDTYAALPAGEKTKDRVTVAGRIMAIRNNGMFIVILDDTDRLQIFHDLKHLSAERTGYSSCSISATSSASQALCVARRAARSRSMLKSFSS